MNWNLGDLALVFGSLGMGGVLVKLLDWRTGKVTARQIEVDTIRTVLNEVREEGRRKEDKLARLETRVEALEQREREALTRAAIHEAWDQVAYPLILATNPAHPPPPPIVFYAATTTKPPVQTSPEPEPA